MITLTETEAAELLKISQEIQAAEETLDLWREERRRFLLKVGAREDFTGEIATHGFTR